MAILILIALFRVLYVPRTLAHTHNQLARRQLLHLSYAVCFSLGFALLGLLAWFAQHFPKIVGIAVEMTSSNRNSIRIIVIRLFFRIFCFCFVSFILYTACAMEGAYANFVITHMYKYRKLTGQSAQSALQCRINKS